MTVNKNTIEALKNLGLSDYETRAYIANISLISATATEISLESNVPRSKIYEILKSLAKKGFVEIEKGKPLKFNVVPPHEIFEKSRREIKERLDDAETELNFIYENQIPKVPAPIWLVNGPEKNVNKELEIISRAKNSLFILGGFMFQNEIPELKKRLNKVIKRGVTTKIVAAPSCIIDNDKIDIVKEIGKLDCEMKIFQVPHIKIVIRDEKEMIITFCKRIENNLISQTAIGIWNQHNEFVETISGVYNFIWTVEPFSNPTALKKQSKKYENIPPKP